MGDGIGGEHITRYEAEKLMTEALKQYEREVVAPRHRETQEALEEITDLVQQGAGAKKVGSVIVAFIGIIWIVLQITEALKH